MAGNQLGKTYSGAMEAAYHATGLYPDWWEGKRFDKATVGWAAGVTGESTRDTVQRLMLGRVGEFGTGSIPGDCIIETKSAGTIPDLVGIIRVKHVSGGVSTIVLKSYVQGREKWQGETLDWVWYDEEPPLALYIEGITRTNATGGIVWITFTPLLGMSEVVVRFLMEESPDRAVINMTIDDVEHYSQEERDRIIASYPPHEREARAKGIPIMGSGRVFPVEEDAIKVDPFPIPNHWVQINGVDFGWDHPFAAVRMAWDRDADCIYFTQAYRAREEMPIIHAHAINAWGKSIPTAWPHDGLQHDKGSGQQLSEQYRKAGLNMLPERATFEDGTNSVEPGIMDMLERMQTSRLKVFSNLEDWFEEFRLYHRKDGKIVKVRDDLMAASRYALMMRRFATPHTRQVIIPKLRLGIK